MATLIFKIILDLNLGQRSDRSLSRLIVVIHLIRHLGRVDDLGHIVACHRVLLIQALNPVHVASHRELLHIIIVLGRLTLGYLLGIGVIPLLFDLPVAVGV